MQVESGQTPRNAAIIAMQELMGPIIGITLVLMSVFLPAAFIPGITGQMYRQFALVIAATALISGINAITLKPTQSAKYVRVHDQNKPKNWLFRAFDKVYNPLEIKYASLIQRLVDARKTSTLVALGIIIVAIFGLISLPTGFIPTEDQGYLMVAAQLPDASSIERTNTALAKVSDIARAIPGVQHAITIGGISPLEGNASLANAGLVYLTLKDWSERAKNKGQDLRTIYTALNQKLSAVKDISPLVLIPPPIPGLGMSGGFQMQLELTDGSGDLNKLQAAAESLINVAKRRPEIGNIFTPLRTQVPQLRLTINRARTEMLGVAVNDVYDVLQSYLGSSYVGQFSKFGQNYTIYVQADQSYRMHMEQIATLTVRNSTGSMVPLGSFLSAEKITGPALVSQYQMYPTATINGMSAHGYSSGQALKAMEEVAAKVLPQGITYEWTALSYQEKLVGNAVVLVFALAILLVYLVLAGQYESWWLPIPVILAVPMSLIGTVLALSATGLANNIYVQIGLVLLIALSAKNAILIVEVAEEMRHAGHNLLHAAVEGSRRRFRPILMTSFAFILGVVPLVLASGAGAAARISIGLTVFSGMLASTILAVAFVPVLYVMTVSWSARHTEK